MIARYIHGQFQDLQSFWEFLKRRILAYHESVEGGRPIEFEWNGDVCNVEVGDS